MRGQLIIMRMGMCVVPVGGLFFSGDGAGPGHAAGPYPGWSRTRAQEILDSHVGDLACVWVT